MTRLEQSLARRPEVERTKVHPIQSVSALSPFALSEQRPGGLVPALLLQLQRTIGNRAVGHIMANNSATVQRMRDEPEEKSSKELYQKNKGLYEKDLSKGQGYLKGLQERRSTFSEVKEKPKDIQEKLSKENMKIEQQFNTTVELIDEGEGSYTYQAESTNIQDSGNFYSNFIELPSGKIKADNNQDGKNKTPPSNSEILWIQYSRALKHYNENFAKEQQKPQLSSIIRSNVINPETKAVIWMVYKDDEELDRTVTPDSDEGKALLGTPNGKSAVWLLYDHLEEFGNKDIKAIHLTRKKKVLEDKFFMEIEFT